MSGNLIVPSSEQARKYGAKGGKKSGEVRRRKKALRERMKALLELPVSDYEDLDKALLMGLDNSEIDNETLLVIALFEKAKSGDVKAFQEIRNLICQDNATEELKIKKKELQLKENSSREDKIAEAVTIIDDIKTD